MDKPKQNMENGGAGNGSDELNEWEIMAQEAAKEAAEQAGVDPNNVSEDDIAYQKKMMEMARRSTDFDPLSDEEMSANETNTGINKDGEEYERMPWNRWDMYGRVGKDSKREHYDARMAWSKHVEEVAATIPRRETIRTTSMEGSDYVGEHTVPESDKEYRLRVMNAVYAEIAKEQAEDPSRKLSQIEIESLQTYYPREEGESTKDWAQRITDETGVRFGSTKTVEVKDGGEPEPIEEPEETEPITEPEPEPVEEPEEEPEQPEAEETMTDQESWDARMADAKSKFEKMHFVDGTEESDEDYERRMATLVLSNVSTEMANDLSRQLTDVELTNLADMYPRGEKETAIQWAARIKDETNISVDPRRLGDLTYDPSKYENPAEEPLTPDVERFNTPEEQEAREKHERAEKLRKLFKSDALKYLCEMYNVSPDDIDGFDDDEIIAMYRAFGQKLEDFAKNELGMTDEDLQRIAQDGSAMDLILKYNEYLKKKLHGEDEPSTEDGEQNEAMEAEKAALIEQIDWLDLRNFLKEEGLRISDIENMSIEELKDLKERLRKRMVESLDIEDMMDVLKADGFRIKDLEEADFERLVDIREAYRMRFISDCDTEANADKLKEWDIRVIDLQQMTLEELIDLKKRLAAENGQGAVTEEEPVPEEREPLVAVMIDRERDAKIAARALAEEMFQNKLNGEGKKIGRMGRWWRQMVFGQMLKDATMLKYEREALDAIKEGKADVRGVNVDQFWDKNGDGASGKIVERLTMAYVNGIEDSLLHGAAGNEMTTYGVELDENGNKVVFKYSEGGNRKEAVDADSVEAKSTIAIREAVAAFASGTMNEDDFREAVKREKANMAKEGLDDSLMADTLLEVAQAAKERFNHEESIENVMEGFRFINADYQAQVRTEVHRSKIDEISEKISGKLGFAQPEVIAAAAGIALFFTQRGASTVARSFAPLAGGALVSGTFAAFKEHNRVAVDRAELARRIARGEEIGKTKYDQQMEQTNYKNYTATELTNGLREAIASGDADQIQQRLAAIEVLSQIGDSEKIDLITFSGGDSTTIEDERLALDVQIAQAKVELRNRGIENNSQTYVDAANRASEFIRSDMEAKDAAFKKLQRKRVAAQFAKTAVVGVATAVVGQEVAAAFNPSSYGIFDKINDSLDIRFAPLGIGVNNVDAHRTLLAGALGITQTEIQITHDVVRAAEASGAHLTQQEIDQLRKEGYTVNGRNVTTYTTSSHTEQMTGSEFMRENGVHVSREWGSNGTSVSEGNELGLWRANDGHLYTHMHGNSFSYDGTTYNFDDVAQTGNVSLLVTLSRDAQSTPISVPGVLGPDGQLSFVSSDPAINDILSSGRYAFTEVAYDTGAVASNGAHEMFVFATHVGSNNVSETFEKVVTETIPHVDTVYDVIGFETNAEKIIEHANLIDGGIPLPFVTRKNLTRGEKGQSHGPRGPETFNPGNGGSGHTGDNTPPAPTPNGGTGSTGTNRQPNPPAPGPNGPSGPAPNNGEQTPNNNEQTPSGEQTPSQPTSETEPQQPSRPEAQSVANGEPITLSSDQLRQMLANETYPDTMVARAEYAIQLWNQYTTEQRRAILAGDYSSFDSSDLIKSDYDFLIAKNIIRPDVAPDISRLQSVVDLGGVWGKQATRAEFTDDEIDAIELGDANRKQIKDAIAVWNAASEQDRIAFLKGDGRIGTPVNDAGIALMHLGHPYIGFAEDVANLKQEASEGAVRIRQERERREAEEREQRIQQDMAEASNFQTITNPVFAPFIKVTNDRIDAMNGRNMGDAEHEVIREAISTWNRESRSNRRMMAVGNYDVLRQRLLREKSANEVEAYIAKMKDSMKTLEQYGIVAFPKVASDGERAEAA